MSRARAAAFAIDRDSREVRGVAGTVKRETAERAAVHGMMFPFDDPDAKLLYFAELPFSDDRLERIAAELAGMFKAGATISVDSLVHRLGERIDSAGGEVFVRGLARDEAAGSALVTYGVRGLIDELAGTPSTDQPDRINPKDPLQVARSLIAGRYTHGGRATLVHHDGCLRAWTGTHYARLDDAAARAAMYAHIDHTPNINGERTPPTAALVTNCLDALRAVAYIDSRTELPSWLRDTTVAHPRDLIPCANGLLNITARELIPHTPDFFNAYALPFSYNPEAPAPTNLLGFLQSIWLDDSESIETFQEMVGYLLANWTHYQKAFLVVGPKRSGKGTIARLLRKLQGENNVVVPTLTSLAGPFGLQPLIDKPLAVISDARLGGRSDQAVIAERILAITGEDAPTVDRKHQPAWTGKLPTRFLLLTNELPRVADASGAFASRFVVLTMRRSFYGNEDHGLDARLENELPAILNWALDGLARLADRGHFVTPAASEDAVRELEDLGSPIGAFVRDNCVVEAGAEIDTDALYARWKTWCEGHGRTIVTTEQVFGRDLRAAVPGLVTASRRSQGERFRVYVGIRLREG